MSYVFRVNQASIEYSFESSFITAILGARRVGKSTLVEQYAKQHPNRCWVFLNMDKRTQRLESIEGHLHRMIEQLAKKRIGQGEKIWVVIDEVQKCPENFNQIKVLYDSFKDKQAIKFILTGSGYLSLHRLSAETLAGRIQLHRLREFSLREIAHLSQPDIEWPRASVLDILLEEKPILALKQTAELFVPFQPILQSALEKELIWGGFPELLKLPHSYDRIEYIANYLQAYLEKDIRSLETISDLNLYQQLMEILSIQTGSVRQEKRILETLHCSPKTFKKYLNYLQASMMYKELFPYIKSPFGRLVKSPKGYLINNGLISFLTDLYEIDKLMITRYIGYRFENWFLKELTVWLDREPRKHDIYFWRLHGGVEVDFVVDKKNIVLPFEVTYGKKANATKVKNLKLFLARETRAPFGIYIYNGELHYDSKTRIYFIPAWLI